MNFKLLALTAAILATGLVSGCSSNSDNDNGSQPPVVTDPGDGTSEAPEQYVFANSEGDSTVLYTGQTRRHVLIADIATYINGLNAASPNVAATLEGYMADAMEGAPLFDLNDWELEPTNDMGEFTYNAIHDGARSLKGKIAGGYTAADDTAAGETGTLIDEFFGWEDGLEAGDKPIDLVDYYIAQIESLVASTGAVQVPLAGGTTGDANALYVDQYGRDFKQLTQKFLLMAVTFSQGTNDYLQTDFAAGLDLVEGKTYTNAEHKWDEAFGYFGAARNYNEYTDDQIAAGDALDMDEDGNIDIRSEYNFGQSTNCAKRDRKTVGHAEETNFTKDAFDAFLAGRQIIHDASVAGELTEDAAEALQAHAETAALTWEKCIAATAVHYINDVRNDLAGVDAENGTYDDVAAFTNLAKHWSEMKGFALGLQFSPYSPFRTRDDMTVMDLQVVLSLMEDAPVLADGTLLGQPYEGGVEAYRENLLEARNILQNAYDFHVDNVATW